MKRFGYLIGMAFQIIDDILDYEEHKSFGKETGKDFFEGKVTLPLVITIQNLQKNDLQIITDIFNSKSFNKESFELVRKLIKSTNSIEQCRKVVSGFLFDASQILSSFSHSKERSLLIDLIDFFEKRFV
jgi:octaprenyl-diphosphate synthase